MFTDANHPFILHSNYGGNTLELLIGIRQKAKCELKSFSFFSKLQIILPFTFSGGILGIFLFRNVFRVDQYAFGIVEG